VLYRKLPSGVSKVRRVRLRIVAAVLAAFLLAGIGAAVAPAPAEAATPAAPTWLSNYLSGKLGKDVATSIMKALGYDCAGGSPFLCWHSTDYDPPLWFRYGVVQTGNGPNGYLNARGWPSTNAAIIRTFPENWKLVIFCQTQGPAVYGRWGWTTTWDYIGHYGDAPMFVSDGFVYTGTNGYVSRDCGATNMGGNP